MFEITISSVLAGFVSLFFFAGAIGNWIAPPKIAADYARWGYPAFFHYITAILEAVASAAILLPGTRPYGALLGAGVMVAAVVTLIRHKEYAHAIPALFTIAACAAVLTLDG